MHHTCWSYLVFFSHTLHIFRQIHSIKVDMDHVYQLSGCSSGKKWAWKIEIEIPKQFPHRTTQQVEAYIVIERLMQRGGARNCLTLHRCECVRLECAFR